MVWLGWLPRLLARVREYDVISLLVSGGKVLTVVDTLLDSHVSEAKIVHYDPKKFDFGKKKAFPMRPQHFYTSVEKAMKVNDGTKVSNWLMAVSRRGDALPLSVFVCRIWTGPQRMTTWLASWTHTTKITW